MFTKKLLTTLGVIGAIITLVASVWAYSHYMDNFATIEVVDTKIEQVEIQVAGAIQNQQMKSDVKFYQFMYEKLTQEKNSIRREIRLHPNDADLQRDYDEIILERKRVKDLLDRALREIQ